MTRTAPPAVTLTGEIRSLTALRFVAALFVVVFHFTGRSEPESVLRSTVFLNGDLGVDLFFVLSGFILKHVYVASVEVGTFRTGDFLIARLARLYPLHLLTMALTIAAALAASRVPGVAVEAYAPLLGIDSGSSTGPIRHGLAHLLLLHAWGVESQLTFNGPSWSISAEWFAYLLFPAVAAAALTLGRWRALLGAVALLLGAELLSRLLGGKALTERTFDLGILRVLPEFALGAATYLALRGARPPRGLVPAGIALALIVCALAFAGLAPTILVPLAFAVLIAGLAVAEGRGQRWAQPPGWLVYLGEISYSIYMLHLLVGRLALQAAGRVLGYGPGPLPIPVLLLGLIVVLAVAALCYELFEQPARRWVRRRRMPERRPEASPSSA